MDRIENMFRFCLKLNMLLMNRGEKHSNGCNILHIHSIEYKTKKPLTKLAAAY